MLDELTVHGLALNMGDVGDDSASEEQWLYGDSNPDQPNVDNANNLDDGSKNIDPDGPTDSEPQVGP